MAAIPAEITNPTVDAIYKAYEARREKSQRPHLGASMIGEDCERALWLSFRWVTEVEFQGRMLRLFDTGHKQEQRMVDDLRAIGVEVHDADENGKQFSVSAHGGHFQGSMDGVALGIKESPSTWHVLEFKTSNAKNFAALKKDGVEKNKPRHYAQMQVYMFLSGLERAFYMAVNKDSDEIYSERVKLDKAFAQRMVDKAGRIIFAARPPSRIHNDPAWWACKFCDQHPNCHMGAAPEKNCRTCARSTPLPDGTWVCTLFPDNHDTLSVEMQRNACPNYHVHPDLVKA